MQSSLNTTYGRMKLKGKKRVIAGGVGRVAELWNVYGYQKVGFPSHILSNWLHACASGRSSIRSSTDGHERSQHVYAEDLARALVDMMADFADLAPVTDVTTGPAIHATKTAGGTCHVQFSHSQAPVNTAPEPVNLWKVRQAMGASMVCCPTRWVKPGSLSHCPPSLVIPNWFGRSGNNLVQLAGAVHVANATQAALVIPRHEVFGDGEGARVWD